MTLLCNSLGIGDGTVNVNPIIRCGVQITPDINPIYGGFGKESYEWGGLVYSIRTQLDLGPNNKEGKMCENVVHCIIELSNLWSTFTNIYTVKKQFF